MMYRIPRVIVDRADGRLHPFLAKANPIEACVAHRAALLTGDWGFSSGRQWVHTYWLLLTACAQR